MSRKDSGHVRNRWGAETVTRDQLRFQDLCASKALMPPEVDELMELAERLGVEVVIKREPLNWEEDV
jgi:hypothetical protein